MSNQELNATPEQLAVLIDYCRSQIQQYAYGLPADLKGVVEAISGPCFAEIGDMTVAIDSDGVEV